MTKQILLIGSADPTAGIPYQVLPRRWYHVAIVADEDEAIQRLQQDPPDLVLLDTSLPYPHVTKLCAALRDQDPPLPVVLFGQSRFHVRQLRKLETDLPLCATLIKPCEPTDLTTAVSKLVHQVRQRKRMVPILQRGPLVADLMRRQVTKNGQPVALTPKQYDLLVLLMRHPGQVVSRQTIMQEIWQTSWLGDTRTLDVHIRMIRQGVEDNPSRPRFVRTVRGRGYVFQIPEPGGQTP